MAGGITLDEVKSLRGEEMFKESATNRIKHIDFIVLDVQNL